MHFGEQTGLQVAVGVHLRKPSAWILLVAKVWDEMAAWIREKAWTLMMENSEETGH
jgi:hypothetical protein